MKRALFLVAILAGATSWACGSGPRADVPIANAEDDILAQERVTLDNWAAGDAVGYAQGAASDVTYFDDIGASDRIDGLEAFQAYLASLDIPQHRYEIVDPKVQVYGDVGILTLHYHGLMPDGTVGSDWKATVVYKYDAGTWHKVHAHWSLVRES